MSFQQLNLQKDGIHNLYNTVGESSLSALGTPGTKNNPSNNTVSPTTPSSMNSPLAQHTTMTNNAVVAGSRIFASTSLPFSPMTPMGAFLTGNQQQSHLVTPTMGGLTTSPQHTNHNSDYTNDNHDDEDEDDDALSTISKKSWATISEIDSQCYSVHSATSFKQRRPSLSSSRRNSSRSIAEADEEEEEDDDDNDDDEEKDAEAELQRRSQLRPPATLTVVMRASMNGIHNVREGTNQPLTKGTTTNTNPSTAWTNDENVPSSHREIGTPATFFQTAGAMMMRGQAGGDSTSERGDGRSINRSASFSTRGTTHSTLNGTNDGEDYPTKKISWRQRCVQAEEHVFDAREELSLVEAQLDSLQHRHALELRDLHREVIQHTAVQQELRNTVRIQEQDLETVQTKLRTVQNEKDALEDQLKARSLVEDQQEQQQQKLASVGHVAAVAASKNLQRQVEELLAVKASAERKLEDALQQLKVVESERNDALSHKERLQSELETSQKRVRFADEKNQILEYQVADYDMQLKESKRQADETAKQLSRLEENLHTIQKDHKELRQLHLEVVKNQKAVHTLKCLELQKQSECTERAQQELESLRKAQVVMDEKVQSLEQERTELQFRLDMVTAELEEASSTLKQQGDSANQRQIELKQHLQAVVQNLDRANEQSAAFDKQRTKLELEYQESQKIVTTLQEDRDRTLLQHKSTVAAFEKSIADLLASAKESQSKVEELVNERDGLKTRIEDLEAERSSLKEKHETVQSAHIMLENTYQVLQERLTQKVQTHEEAVTEFDNQMKDLRMEKDELQNTLGILRFEVTHLESLLLTANTMQKEARLRLVEEEATKEKLRLQLEDLHGSVQAEREEECKKLDAALQEQDRLTEQTASAVEELDSASRSWIVELSTLQNNHNEQEQELHKIEALYKAVVESRDECQRQLERALESQEIFKQTTEKQIEELKTTEGRLLQQVDTLEHGRNSLEEKLAGANSMLKEANDRLAEQEVANANLTKQLSLALEEAESLKSQLIAAAIERETIEAMHAKIVVALEIERDGLHSEVVALKEKHSTVCDKLATVRQERDMMKVVHDATLLDHAQTDQKYTQEIEKVQSQVIDLQSEQERLVQMVSSLEAERSTLQQDVANETRKLDSIKCELQKSMDAHQAMNQELQGLRQSMTALETDRTKVLDEKLALQNALIEQVARTSESQGELEYLTMVCKKLQTELDAIRLSHTKIENDLKQSQEQLLSSPSKMDSKKDDDAVTLRSIGNGVDEAQFMSLQKDNKELHRNNASLESQLRVMKVTVQKSDSELVAKENDLKLWTLELEKSRKDAMESQLELQTSRTLLAEHTSRERKMDAELKSMTQRLIETEQELNVRASLVAHFGAEKEELNKQLVQANAEIVLLRRDLVEAKVKLEHSVALVSSATEMMASTAREAEDATVQNQLLYKTHTSDLERQNFTLQQEMVIMREENEKQTVKIRKLAKLLKKTLREKAEDKTKPNRSIEKSGIFADNDVFIGGSSSPSSKYSTSTSSETTRRVARMKMQVILQYHDKITKEKKMKEVHAEYTGPLVDSKPHGPGMLKFVCGDMYLGMFHHGKYKTYCRRRWTRCFDKQLVCLRNSVLGGVATFFRLHAYPQ
jgi:chromosome segregation ATPase